MHCIDNYLNFSLDAKKMILCLFNMYATIEYAIALLVDINLNHSSFIILIKIKGA